MTEGSVTVAGLDWSPLLPWPLLAGLAALATALVLWGLARRARGSLWRLLALAALLVVLGNPQVVREARTPLADVAFVVVDDSASQDLADRPARTAEAVAALRQRLDSQPGLEVRVVRAGGGGETEEARGTRLFTALERASADVPPDRLAGALLVTDGQVHDVPDDPARAFPAPVHTLLTGRRDETDRRLTVESAPTFGLVDDAVTVRVAVRDTAAAEGDPIPVSVTVGDQAPQSLTVPNGGTRDIPVTITHGGANVVELAAEARPDELTARNNRTALSINGVRDRLRVLLISGSPHVGERAWRRLLKSDPNVDLVHFTILRPPTKDDGTPLSELALIAFPIRELFEERLSDFDLIVFDRYSRQGLVPFGFLENIATFVEDGGALLLASGPEYAGPYSLFDSPLGDILPAAPTGQVLSRAFRPRLSDEGRRHPVTAALPGGETAAWGPWTRQVEGGRRAGRQLMTGADGQPLMLLDRVGDGRVALLLSDTIWLWARGWRGGGPQQELIRRMAHWLMKEPELEEEALTARADGDALTIERRTLADLEDTAPLTAQVTAPDGTEREVPLPAVAPGRARATLPADQPGVWRIHQGDLSAVAAVGTGDPLEMRRVVATEDVLAPVAAATGGAIRWLDDGPPRIERVSGDGATHGAGWLGLRANDAYVVDGIRQAALLPPLGALALALGALMLAWWREGRPD